MPRLARALGLLALSAGALAHYRIRSAALDPSLFVYAGKVLAQAAAPALLTAGAAGAALGLLSGDALAAGAGATGALLLGRYLAGVLAAGDGLAPVKADDADGRGFSQIRKESQDPAGVNLRRSASSASRFNSPPKVAYRYGAGAAGSLRSDVWPLAGPVQAARVQRDVAFWNVPGPLLCDLWQPPPGVPPSGVGIIYLHAGGWQNFDKDTGTRPFFRRLAGQGHVVMDVAYRLCGDTDMWGMLGDVKRAVAWLKRRGQDYGVDPARIVLCGASAGGHLALLAAYTANQARFAPSDLAGADTAVSAVCSYYGVPDMLRFGAGPVHPDWPSFVRWGRKVGIVTRRNYLAWPDVERRLFGARAHEVPEIAALLSPINHVGPGCPPTLLIHGSHDRVVGVEQARDLYAALRAQGVPVAYLELPRVDHAFDLIAPQISPSARRALNTFERFLELLVSPWSQS